MANKSIRRKVKSGVSLRYIAPQLRRSAFLSPVNCVDIKQQDHRAYEQIRNKQKK